MKTLLYWASIESKSCHPMAKALTDYAQLHSIGSNPQAVTEFHNYPGEGIHGKLDSHDIFIGNRRIAKRAHCQTVEIEDGASGGKTRGYIYSDGNLVGWFSLSDACRSGAVQAVNKLKSMNILTMMLTGDSHAAAAQAQDQLRNAIEVVHSELLPEDKARIIKECEGPVAMIGDGVNDAPALATADVGISMGLAGSALATETGNIILMSNDIRKVPKVIGLARRAYNKVIQNLILSVVIKGCILALGIAGHPLVWAAVLADVGTCLLVIFNSMLLLGGTGRTSREPPKCLKDPQQIFKLPDEDIESQTTDKDIQIGSNGAGENAWVSKGCRRRCCSKTTDDAGTRSGEIALANNGLNIEKTTTMHDREIHQDSESCLKECCSIEKEKSRTKFSPSSDISLGISDSASMHAGHNLAIREAHVDSRSCAKGCCSKQYEKSCTGSDAAEIGLFTSESARNDAHGSLEKIQTPARSKNCSKGCCAKDKRDNSATGSSNTDNGSNVDECSTKLAEESLNKIATSAGSKSCTKGCCVSNKLNKSVTESSITSETVSGAKLEQESIETYADSKKCKKGCCGSNKRDNSVMGSSNADTGANVDECSTKLAQESLNKIATSAGCKSCTKGCCGSNKLNKSVTESSITSETVSGAKLDQESIETYAGSKKCKKDCCGSNKRDNSVTGSSKTDTIPNAGEGTTKLAKENFEQIETLTRSKSCTKGCCGSNEINKSVIGLSKASETSSSNGECITKLANESSGTRGTPTYVVQGCKKGCCGNKEANPDTQISIM